MASFALNDYTQVILDGSFFINRFPEELIRGLDEEIVYLAPTFSAECAAYIPHMTPQQRAVFDDNLELLQEIIHKDKKSSAKTLEHADDLWTNLCIISGQGRGRTLLISSNLLLIQKVVLRQLNVDVYNLHEMKFMSHTTYTALKKDYQCKIDRRLWEEDVPDSRDRKDLPDTLEVLDENGWMQTLNKASGMSGGLEANMYLDRTRPDELVKVFKWNFRTEEKLKNVEQLQRLNREMLQCEWASFPMAKVYSDNNPDQPLGFYMKKFEGYGVLENEVNWDFRPDKRFSKILDWCRKLVSQVAYLGVFGIYITDYNEQNFLIPSEDAQDQHIVMLDTDSFCLGEYYGARYNSEWEGWRLLDIAGKRGSYVANKADVIDVTLKLLYAEVFSILSIGFLPIKNDRFVADNETTKKHFSDSGLMRYLFPGNVWKLMEAVFTRREADIPMASEAVDRRIPQIPSMDLLYHALTSAKKNQSEEDLDLTYEELVERHKAGRRWRPNGLHAQVPEIDPEPHYVDPDPEPEFEPEEESGPEPEPERPVEPKPDSRRRRREPQQRSRSLRKVDRKDHFAQPRLMGAVLEHQPQEATDWEFRDPEKGFRVMDRVNVTRWKDEQELDRERASETGNWMTKLLFLALIVCVAWLCFFAEIDLIYQIRQMALDFLSGIVLWWEEIVLPLLQNFWEGGIARHFTR